MLRFTSPLCSPLRGRRGDGGEVGARDAALEAFLDTLVLLALDRKETARVSCNCIQQMCTSVQIPKPDLLGVIAGIRRNAPLGDAILEIVCPEVRTARRNCFGLINDCTEKTSLSVARTV